jgi:hypothetical protein
MISNSITEELTDIDDTLSTTSIARNFTSLNTVFMPTGRKISKWKHYFRVGIRPKQIMNYLFRYFQLHPISSGILDPYWLNSNIPHFLNDLRVKFSTDLDVIQLLQIQNIKKIMSIQN